VRSDAFTCGYQPLHDLLELLVSLFSLLLKPFLFLDKFEDLLAVTLTANRILIVGVFGGLIIVIIRHLIRTLRRNRAG